MGSHFLLFTHLQGNNESCHSDQHKGPGVNSASTHRLDSSVWNHGGRGCLPGAPETLALVAGVAISGGLSGPTRSAGVGMSFTVLRTLNMGPQVLL